MGQASLLLMSGYGPVGLGPALQVMVTLQATIKGVSSFDLKLSGTFSRSQIPHVTKVPVKTIS